MDWRPFAWIRGWIFNGLDWFPPSLIARLFFGGGSAGNTRPAGMETETPRDDEHHGALGIGLCCGNPGEAGSGVAPFAEAHQGDHAQGEQRRGGRLGDERKGFAGHLEVTSERISVRTFEEEVASCVETFVEC